MKNHRLIVGIIAAIVTIIAGRWGLGLFTKSEYVHFSVNFPTEEGYHRLSREELGGLWARLDSGAWKGYPKGGLLVWGREGALTVDIGKRGWIKKLVDPSTLLLSTHWLRNVGTIPRKIRLELNLCDLDVKWMTFENFFDYASKTSTRLIEPRETFNMDWIVIIPRSRCLSANVCEGDLLVFDAVTEKRLTQFPIRIINSSTPLSSGGTEQ